MEKTVSADGTVIAFDRLGNGPAVITVAGMLCDRAKMGPIAEELAKHFTVFNYDRRGRGDSGDTTPYAIEREVEDLAAILGEAGARASVYAHSSGAGLALHATARGLPMAKLVLHEAPYTTDSAEERRTAQQIGLNLRQLLGSGRHGDAVELMMIATGLPADLAKAMRFELWWPAMEAMAPTMRYDSDIMGDLKGGSVPVELVASVTVPALVLVGGDSPDFMLSVGRQICAGLPAGTLRILEGQEHVVPPEVLVPVLADFFAGSAG